MKKLFSVRTILLAGSLLLQLSTLCIHSRGAAGDVDLSFNPGSSVTNPVSVVVVQPDGKVIIGGLFTFINGTNRYGSSRLNPDGSLDSTFISSSFNPELPNLGSTTNEYDSTAATAVAVQPDGKILVGGASTHYYNCDPFEGACSVYTIYFVTRLNPNGSRDTNFTGAGAVGHVSSIAVQSDGKVVIGSDAFTAVKIVRLNADGSLDSSFNPGTGPNGSVSSVASQADGKVLVGGYFTAVNGVNRTNIARLNANGSLDSSFNPGTQANGTVRSIALQPDGKVLIGGDFTNVNGTNRNHITRLNADGGLDLSFNPGTGTEGTDADNRGSVRSIALQSDGKVLIGGDFTTVNGVARPYVARLYGDSVAPSLSLARSNGFVIVSWPSSSTGFVLQQSTDMNLSHWTTPSQTVAENGTTRFISVNPAAGNRYYRLFKP